MTYQLQHGTEFYPRQPLTKPSACWRATLDCFNNLNDGDASALITRANYICSNANATFAATPLFVIAYNLQKGRLNGGLDLTQSPLNLMTTSNDVAGRSARTWMYYSRIAQVFGVGNVVISQ